MPHACGLNGHSEGEESLVVLIQCTQALQEEPPSSYSSDSEHKVWRTTCSGERTKLDPELCQALTAPSGSSTAGQEWPQLQYGDSPVLPGTAQGGAGGGHQRAPVPVDHLVR